MESQPVMGLWPSSEADQLDEWLAVEADNSMRAWANSIFALPRFRGIGVVNFYYTDELATWISALNREES
ncbi:hypothetical protein J2W40_002559 [Sphingobium xenophagum]|uniref:Uncharacterized protein n=2 Tax=Sphingobium xenophagum TaxID=121428 RepID=A0ABU1X2B3_SPHXE|nr:hypothetical protein [Sphingobium xenophagum]MDR7155723.1 hypothetical protein [Sphingobium xenophagum]